MDEFDVAEFDVIVIGAGPTGENAAGRVADGGLTVAIVERELIGGECSCWGCVPSKTLLRPGDVLAAARRVPGAADAITGGPACPSLPETLRCGAESVSAQDGLHRGPRHGDPDFRLPRRPAGSPSRVVPRQAQDQLNRLFRQPSPAATLSVVTPKSSIFSQAPVAHNLLVTIWYVLRDGVELHDLGADYFTCAGGHTTSSHPGCAALGRELSPAHSPLIFWSEPMICVSVAALHRLASTVGDVARRVR